MPIYEFQCTECKEIFEELVGVGKRMHKCPECGGKGKKIISSVGIIFKGSGWYCTDSRSKAAQNGNGSKKSERKESEKVKSDKNDKKETTEVKSESTKKTDISDD
ncbi:FmdB family transcriptional regulator [bacterium]|nr:FmdB family transcriptional regulator [bacterium]MBU1025271.1 FmdB family transcriptional regulator [bacterium]